MTTVNVSAWPGPSEPAGPLPPWRRQVALVDRAGAVAQVVAGAGERTGAAVAVVRRGGPGQVHALGGPGRLTLQVADPLRRDGSEGVATVTTFDSGEVRPWGSIALMANQ